MWKQAAIHLYLLKIYNGLEMLEILTATPISKLYTKDQAARKLLSSDSIRVCNISKEIEEVIRELWNVSDRA